MHSKAAEKETAARGLPLPTEELAEVVWARQKQKRAEGKGCQPPSANLLWCYGSALAAVLKEVGGRVNTTTFITSYLQGNQNKEQRTVGHHRARAGRESARATAGSDRSKTAGAQGSYSGSRSFSEGH